MKVSHSYPSKNCFTYISFVGCQCSIYGGIPAEIVYAVLLGLCEYIAEIMTLTCTLSEIGMISHIVVGIYKDSRYQSERDLPDLGSFRNGLIYVKSLNAKERFSWIYYVFLEFYNSYLVKDLCKKKCKKPANWVNTLLLSKYYLRGYVSVVEDTLLCHIWFKNYNYLKSDLQ